MFLVLVGVFTRLSATSSYYPITSSGVYFGGRGSRMEWNSGSKKFFGYEIGPSAGIDYRKPNHIYGGYRFYWMYGNSNAGSCHRSMSNMDMQARVGYTFGVNVLLTPYTGVGVTAVQRKNKNTTGPCHHVSYTAVYVPVGAVLSVHPSASFSVALDYQYTSQIDSYYKAAGFHNINFSLQKKGQHSVELPFQFCYPTPRFHNVQYRIIPFYRTYYYGNAMMSCSCACQCDATINLPLQRGYEWGIRYEIAIW